MSLTDAEKPRAAPHSVEADARTLHGRFDRDLAPILTIDPGDRVVFRTLDAAWHTIEQRDPFARPERFEPRDTQLDRGHALCGPVEVRGAEPGMVLRVDILELRTGRWGWSSAGGFESPLNARLGVTEPPQQVVGWALDPDRGVARDAQGRELAIRPFMGVLGMPPDLPGPHSTIPPRPCGGNVDCKELIAGSRLYLPVPVQGGRFSVGDGHALQGDGEVSGLALECPMERVELEFHLLEDARLAMPRAETPAGWITLGFHEDLDEAMAIALEGMLDLLHETLGVSRREALGLASLVVDLRVTQVVNGVRGVHAVLPHGRLAAPRRATAR